MIPSAGHQDDVLKTSIQPHDPPFQYFFRIPAGQPPGLYWYHPRQFPEPDRAADQPLGSSQHPALGDLFDLFNFDRGFAGFGGGFGPGFGFGW
jgi:hypothetical protein